MRIPVVTAHTGCEGTPDNSMASFRQGVLSGADMAEVDLVATRDGVVFLRHDAWIGTEGSKQAIHTMDWADYQAGLAGKPVVRLEELLEAQKDTRVTLNLDVKSPEALPAIVAVLRQADARGRVVLSGCQKEEAAWLKTHAPDLRWLYNVNEHLEGRDRHLETENQEACCQSAMALGASGINLHHRWLTPALVAYAHRHFLMVSVWTVNEEEDLLRCLSMGADSVTTRRPSALRRLLEELNNA